MWMDANAIFQHSILIIYSELIMHQMDGIALKYVIQSDLSVRTELIRSILKIQVKYINFYISEKFGCDCGIIMHWNFLIRCSFGA